MHSVLTIDANSYDDGGGLLNALHIENISENYLVAAIFKAKCEAIKSAIPSLSAPQTACCTGLTERFKCQMELELCYAMLELI